MSSISLGTVIYTAVKPIFKIYFIILCGFFLGKKNILTVETARNVSDIVVSLILPCLVFNKIVTNIENSDIKQIGIVVLISLILFGIGGIGALLIYYITKSPKYWKGGCIMVGLCPNISDLPIAYLTTLSSGLVFSEQDGDMGVAYICIFTTVQVFMQFNMGCFKLIGWDIEQQHKNEDIENSANSKNQLNKDEPTTNTSATTTYSNNNDQNSNDNSSSSSSSSTRSTTPYDSNQNQVFPLESLERITSTTAHSLNTNATSNLSLRHARSQSINDVINEYSQASRILSGKSQPTPGEFTDLKTVPTINKSSSKSIKNRSKSLKFLLFILDNFKRPLSISLIVAIIIAMIPWIKALFVSFDQVKLPNAPDGKPPLSFIMDFTGYLANACVPLGLLILGSTLSRLKIGTMPSGYWQTPLALSILRLIILPIIGVVINTRLNKIGWFDNDKILQFVCTIVFGLPNATSLIYLTAFYTPLEGEHKQMDYLALTYIIEYPLLAISLPFLTTFTIKVSLGY